MSNNWPRVALAELLTQSEKQADIRLDEQYKQVTVRLWGKGVVLRGETAGTDIKNTNQYVVTENQFIVSKIDARNGAFGLIPKSLDGAIVSSDFPVFTLDTSRITPVFLEWMSKTHDFIDICSAASEGTTNRIRLKIRRFLAAEIPLPPLEEQQRIVARIEELAAKVEEARGLREQITNTTKGIYTSALAEKIRPYDESWQRTTVSEVLYSMDSGWSPQCLETPANNNQWGVLKTTSVQWDKFVSEENKALPDYLKPNPELCIRTGDVLVTRAGPRQRVGVVATVQEENFRLMISDKLIRLRVDESKILPRFLGLSLSSPFSQEYLFQRKTGLADAQVNISQTILKATPIAYPKISEQQRIVAYLDDLQAKVDALKRIQAETSAELDALLPSVLDKAFKGEL